MPEAASSILIGLRPEKLEVDADGPPATENRLAGRIAAWSYFGASLTLLIDTPAGQLAATVPSWRCRIAPAAGAPIWLGWTADASVVLEDDR